MTVEEFKALKPRSLIVKDKQAYIIVEGPHLYSKDGNTVEIACMDEERKIHRFFNTEVEKY